MTEEKNENNLANDEVENKNGRINISNHVITNIIAKTIMEIDGVAGVSGGIANGIAKLLGRNDVAQGVKLKIDQESGAASIELNVVINRDTPIHNVARLIQNKVKEVVEDKVGIEVKEINVNVEGIDFAN